MNTIDRTQLRDALTARDLAIVMDIERFRLLSTRQIERLHFGQDHSSKQAATRATHRVLQRLESHQIVNRLERRVGGPQRGSAAALWQLGPRGLDVARPDAVSKRGRFREPASGLFVRHTSAVAEMGVQVIERTRELHLALLTLAPEQHAWQQFLGQHGQPEWLRPDLYVVVANDEFEQHTYVEIDRATEHGPQILRKCEVYARFAAVGAADRTEEADSPLRTPFQRDRDRIVHSKAFRRLKHKTQVFIAPEGDHYRTRLTHTLEACGIARTVARALGLITEGLASGDPSPVDITNSSPGEEEPTS